MIFDVQNIIDAYNYDEEQIANLRGFNVIDVLYFKTKERILFKIGNNKILPFNQYNDVLNFFKSSLTGDISLLFVVDNHELPIKEVNLYLKAFSNQHNGAFKSFAAKSSDNGIVLSSLDEQYYSLDQNELDDLREYFRDLGYDKTIEIDLRKANEFVETRVKLENTYNENKISPAESVATQGKTIKPPYNRRTVTYTDVAIDDLSDTLFKVKFNGEIFKVDERVSKDGKIRQTLYVKDDNNACIVKANESFKMPKEVLSQNKPGLFATFKGNYRFDMYVNDYIFELDGIEVLEKKECIFDNEENKRIELHAHTNKSEMDGVCKAEEIIEAAFKMGHEAVAITDHLDVQAFPPAQRKTKELLKANPDRKFKVLYGVEFNMVDERLNLVYNVENRNLFDSEYIVFDLETTGLSSRHDYIIEFGAVLMHKGNIVERKDFFVKPPIALSTTISELTNISEDNLKEARTFKEAYQEILDFIGDRILVAHNASFDYGFLNEELARIGLEPLKNPVIDTLDFARSLFKNRRSYRLGNIAKLYSVGYDEAVAHRADYDAEVLSQVFNLMLKDAKKNGIETLEDLSNFQNDDAFVKKMAYHTNVICKNKDGLKDLFKLVSISNTDTIAIFGKANTKSNDSEFIAEPRVLRKTLNAYRENLLIGSGCLNGEVFEIASTRSEKQLKEAISFYDYIEIQPLENYRSLIEDRQSFDLERLKQYQRDIINEALAQNKIIVATGDVHYVTKDQKLLRDVYINAQGIGGTHHPLYIYNKEKRAKQVTPDQRFLNTREMLDAFAWLNDDKLIQDIVINNTKKIADMCEEIFPVHSKLYTPVIEGSNEKLVDIIWENAKRIYGDPLDEFIKARIQREIDSIIGNGYGVIYYVSHLLVKKSNQEGYLVGSRGSVGSSLAATLSGITEVNPLPPHYVCPNCQHLEWIEDNKVMSGYNLQDKPCPKCGTMMKGDGQNIPFETFLGFNGDKVPDIDLNFSGDYQDKAHLFTREIFGEDHVFRAGTISTVAEKTAFGYVSGYCEEKGIENMSRAQRQRLASGCEGVKRTTGQHPGGIIVIPNYMDVYDFTPIQYPANDPSATWKTTHFDFHEIHDNVLKFDILGHVDPTAMRLLQNISGIDPKSIPMNDEKVMSLFSSTEALGIINPDYDEKTGACGLPEFGTRFVRGILQETSPKYFSDLVQISGLSHGTDVWNNNAKDLVDQGIPLRDVIGCRDDIMSTMLSYGLPSKPSFDIMEKVRKGKGLSQEHENLMIEHDVPSWYIESCKKIKYMFPKAHATAYVIMAVRIAWFKVYHPEFYYVSFFTLRCDAYEIETMIKDAKGIKARMNELQLKMQSNEIGQKATKKEIDIFNTLEVCYEMVSRGYKLTNIDINRSLATEFLVNPDNNHEIIPPFVIIDGLGENVGISIVKARNERGFISKEDLINRTLLSTTLVKKLEALNVLNHLDDSNQMSLF